LQKKSDKIAQPFSNSIIPSLKKRRLDKPLTPFQTGPIYKGGITVIRPRYLLEVIPFCKDCRPRVYFSASLEPASLLSHSTFFLLSSQGQDEYKMGR